MRILSLLLFLSISISAYSQISFTEYSKHLLIEPSNSDQKSPEISLYFINEYQSLISELESQLDEDLEFYTEINEDIQKIEDVLNLWIDERDKNLSLNFSENYNKEECFTIETSTGQLKSDQIHSSKTVELDSSLLITQEISVDIMSTKGKWVKKKIDVNCISSVPEDCYKACWEKQSQKIFIVYEDNRIEIDTFPLNFEFNSESKKLERLIEIIPTIQKVIDTNGNEQELYSWEKVDCN